MIARLCSVLHISRPSTDGLLSHNGTTVPTAGTSGYAPSCLFQNVSTGVLYVNKGTYASCNFTAVTVA